MSAERVETDILILGSGGAGMLAAMHALDHRPLPRVTIVVKGLLGQSGCTRMVQGGYNAVLNPADSLDKHYTDTIRGGAFLNHQELAWKLVEEAPRRIIELENRAGCLFDRNRDGTIHQKAFAGQSFDRTVHKGDLTGIEIMSNLRDWVLDHPEIRVIAECRALDLITVDGEVRGAIVEHIHTGRRAEIHARATLLATGGGARMYRISSPSLEKSGDGMAMAFRAGAQFVDMEMLQFHPTGLLVGSSIATGGLLEEGLRGAGARLFNRHGERYMEKYAPEKLERATRDVISRSSYMEIMAGRGSDAGGVYLDASHLGAEFLLSQFPGMVERCAGYGFDLVNDRVEVSPSAHYQMGGVVIDLLCRTTVPGLFAAGEDAGGVHGANRLGGNGVADSIVFGGVAGDAMPDLMLPARSVAAGGRPAATPGSKENVFALRKEVEDLMWEKVGVVRRGDGLREAAAQLEELEERAVRAATPARNEALNLINTVAVARMVCASAIERTESRGAHYREDHPAPDPAWLRNIYLTPEGRGMKIETRPVEFTRMKP
ncbi:MAG: FAD-binding protein [Acidobacteria bacterium]|nr:FAD-binding protein [Acidobacteriota bacterium]